MTQTFDIMATLLALAVGITLFFPIAAMAGEPEEQKMLYVSHELAYLIRTSAMLPENSNYLVPDSLEGTTAELLQRRLIVQGPTTRTPPLVLPEDVNTDDIKVNFDFLYVTKTDNLVGLSSVRNDACIKIETAGIDSSKITITTEFYNDADEEFTKKVADNLKDRLKRLHNIQEGGILKINILAGTKERIILNPGVNREHTSLSCFLHKSTEFPIETSSSVQDLINIEITKSTDTNKLITEIANALEEYHE